MGTGPYLLLEEMTVASGRQGRVYGDQREGWMQQSVGGDTGMVSAKKVAEKMVEPERGLRGRMDRTRC